MLCVLFEIWCPLPCCAPTVTPWISPHYDYEVGRRDGFKECLGILSNNQEAINGVAWGQCSFFILTIPSIRQRIGEKRGEDEKKEELRRILPPGHPTKGFR